MMTLKNIHITVEKSFNQKLTDDKQQQWQTINLNSKPPIRVRASCILFCQMNSILSDSFNFKHIHTYRIINCEYIFILILKASYHNKTKKTTTLSQINLKNILGKWIYLFKGCFSYPLGPFFQIDNTSSKRDAKKTIQLYAWTKREKLYRLFNMFL